MRFSESPPRHNGHPQRVVLLGGRTKRKEPDLLRRLSAGRARLREVHRLKAIIPAAGLGTRLLPATKSMPKEMLPVVDKPVIQYVVEEAVAAGIEDILIITGRGKRAIEDHFDHSYELEARLEAGGRSAELASVQAVSDMASIYYVRQKEPLGLGHAVLCGRRFIGDEPFAVLLGDDIFLGSRPPTAQLVDVFEETGSSAFSLLRVPRSEISRYGAVDGRPVDGAPGRHRVVDIVEKPPPSKAPSDLATMGRYVFTAEIFAHLEALAPGFGGEYQLTDAMATLCREQAMFGVEFEGTRLDVGSVAGFVRANVVLALQRPELIGALDDLLPHGAGATSSSPPGSV